MWGATVMGWAQLLSISLAGFLAPGALAACTAVYFSYLSYALWQDSAHHGLGSPLAPLRQLALGAGKQD